MASGSEAGRNLSLVGAIFMLPFLLFSGYAGQLADIYAQLVQSDEIKHRVEQVYGPLSQRDATITAFRQVAEHAYGPLRWFSVDVASLDIGAAVLAVIAAVLVFARHVDLIITIAVMAVLGIAAKLVIG